MVASGDAKDAVGVYGESQGREVGGGIKGELLAYGTRSIHREERAWACSLRTRMGEEKPAKKTEKSAEGTPAEFDVIAKKIEYSSIRNKLKGPALQNAAPRLCKITLSISFNVKDGM